MIGTAHQLTEDNKWVSLVIGSCAAHMVCPPWFATQYPLLQLERGSGPQLRTVTNQHAKLFGYRWVCVTNHCRQQIVIPFYVCEVKQQFFQLLTSQDWKPRLQHNKGFNSILENREGLCFLQAEVTAIPKGTQLQTHSAQQGQTGVIAPSDNNTYTDTGYAGDYRVCRTSCPTQR